MVYVCSIPFTLQHIQAQSKRVIACAVRAVAKSNPQTSKERAEYFGKQDGIAWWQSLLVRTLPSRPYKCVVPSDFATALQHGMNIRLFSQRSHKSRRPRRGRAVGMGQGRAAKWAKYNRFVFIYLDFFIYICTNVGIKSRGRCVNVNECISTQRFCLSKLP